ncbi:MAG: OmpA family protein [Acidobacteriales bacterium]|nr:OmpA family protein [Candidatus Koribacter versatilis]MBI3645763.1 OmpA family protein [Terriglobales bacterium]
MSRRRKRASHANHERWLVSYADFITLLFAFFVVLYASSQVDQRKVGKLAMAIQVAFQEMGIFQASTTQVPMDFQEPMPFSKVQAVENLKRNANLGQIASGPEGGLGGGKENGDLAQLQHELETALTAEIARKEISMRREPDGLVISLREVGFFESGSAQMKTESQPAFDRIAALLRARDCRLRIEGHTDNVPIHNAQFSSNWELSTSRATEIVRVMIVRDGFDAAHLSAAGYAEYHPIASNGGAEGRATNRRVDIVILGQRLPVAAVAQVETAGGANAAGRRQKPSPSIPRAAVYSTNSR